MNPSIWPSWLLRALRQALAVLLPVRCAGCGRADVAVCPACRAELRPAVVRVPDAERVVGAPVVAALGYAGVVARVLGALKEHGRTDAAPAVAGAMRAAVAVAVAAGRARAPDAAVGGAGGPRGSPVLLVAMPSSPAAVRRRGFRVVELLLRRSGCRPPRRSVVRLERRVADQAGLGVAERRANLDGAMRASGVVAGRAVVLVDDVVTTGATLREARRAVHVAGGTVVAAACLAHTAKQKGSVR